MSAASGAVEVLRVDDAPEVEAALQDYHRVDAAAFGLPVDAAQRDSKRAMVEPDRWYLASIDGEPCGGAGSFPTELTLPGDVVVPAAAVSDVGVLTTHRRRGVLSALMRRQLGELADRGTPLAVLHASEGGIYRRFGYGPATRWRLARADARRVRFRDDLTDVGGSLQIVTPAEALGHCPDVHDRARRHRTGGLARNAAWWSVVLGSVPSYLGGNPRHLVMLHRDAAGRSDGYVIYEVQEDWERGQSNHTLVVWELVGESVDVEVALWRAVIEHDLVAVVTGPIAVDHALWDAVLDARQISTVWDQDLLWARVLDVADVLARRRYGAAGSIVIEVSDPFLELAAGTFALEVAADGTAECTTTSAEPELSLDVADLGSCLLGGTSWRRLVRAARVVEHRPGAAATADACFGVDPAPWCWVRF